MIFGAAGVESGAVDATGDGAASGSLDAAEEAVDTAPAAEVAGLVDATGAADRATVPGVVAELPDCPPLEQAAASAATATTAQHTARPLMPRELCTPQGRSIRGPIVLLLVACFPTSTPSIIHGQTGVSLVAG